jgi:hypothetical protein
VGVRTSTDPSELFGKAGGDFLGFRGAEHPQTLDEIGDMGGRVGPKVVRDGAKTVAGAVSQDGIDGTHVIGHQPVTDRLRSAGIVPGHAANGAAGMCRGIHREEQLFPGNRLVQMPEHETRLHQGCAVDGVDVQHAPQML